MTVGFSWWLCLLVYHLDIWTEAINKDTHLNARDKPQSFNTWYTEGYKERVGHLIFSWFWLVLYSLFGNDLFHWEISEMDSGCFTNSWMLQGLCISIMSWIVNRIRPKLITLNIWVILNCLLEPNCAMTYKAWCCSEMATGVPNEHACQVLHECLPSGCRTQ